MFQARDKPRLVALSSTFALGGLLALAIAINGALLLVTDVLFDGTAVIVTTIAAATLYIGLWFVLGLVRRISKDGS